MTPKEVFKFARNVTRTVMGMIVFSISKKNIDMASQGLIGLFCMTKGKANDFFSKVISIFHPPYKISGATGILGDMDEIQLKKVTEILDAKGYYIFDKKIPLELCDKLVEFALEKPFHMRTKFDEKDVTGYRELERFDRANPKAILYDSSTAQLIANPIIQDVVSDTSIIAVAQAYLRSNVIMDALSMWWSAPSPKGDTIIETSQLYHFDMDRIKWLKFFIYLTDVGPENGPHSFIEGSQRTGAIPADLLKRGYQRIQDSEVEKYYSKDQIVEFCSPKGTIFAEDTRGLHKGRSVEKGDRLVLQLEFTNSLFGGKFSFLNLPEHGTEKFKAARRNYPRVYSLFKSPSV